MVSGDTRQQKMFLFVGPKRGGKGTIARVLSRMLGKHNVAGPTLASLGTNFGLQDLIGKPVAVISDARIGSKSDASFIAERLLSVSGEDLQNVDRKYLPPWSGYLPTRFVMLTNELQVHGRFRRTSQPIHRPITPPIFLRPRGPNSDGDIMQGASWDF
jgi:putative DNA primase/helicase